MKKRWIVGLLMSSSLCLLSGCGSSSQEESKDATPQSTESSYKNEESSEKDIPCTEATPFNKNKPVYVIRNDDENMNVKAIVTPYLDTSDKVKVETYEDGDLQKTYIVDYKVEAIQKGDKNHIPIYKYTFYENDSDEKYVYNVTLSKNKDIDRLFIWIYKLDNPNKNLSEEKIKELINNGYGSLMTDESDVVTIK